MTIEEFKALRIAYMRRTGGYGKGNKQMMEDLKNYLKEHGLFHENTTLLGIALDDPARTPESQQRYDVGMVLTGMEKSCGLPVRSIADGRYAVFEVPHTEEGIAGFWKNLQKLTGSLPLDGTKPIIERYAFRKISVHLCEFCLPLRDC